MIYFDFKSRFTFIFNRNKRFNPYSIHTGWSGTAIGSLKKNGSVPHIRTITIFNGNKTEVQTDHEYLEYETWISSCITLGALVGSLLAGTGEQKLAIRMRDWKKKLI